MIALTNAPDDKRVKFIEATTLCEKYFETMESCFSSASMPDK